MIQNSRVHNEDGAVLVVALMMLVLLTILGISISSTSEVELQIAGNEMRYKENLYRAEAAAMVCAQLMDETVEIDVAVEDDWILSFTEGEDLEDAGEVRDDDFWDEDVDTDDIAPGTVQHPTPPAPSLDPDGNAHYVALFAGIPPGEDFESGVREFTIFGRYFDPDRPDLGRSIVRMGYRRVGGIAE